MFFSVDIRYDQFEVDLIIELLSLHSETLLQRIAQKKHAENMNIRLSIREA